MSSRITLVRHGRSAHVQSGWIDIHGFHRWRKDYEAAGIVPGEVPPTALVALAASANVVAASNAPRAIESAQLLAPGRTIVVEPLLREFTLPPLSLRGRFPLGVWAVAVAAKWIASRAPLTAEETQRVKDAVSWLIAQDGVVVAVTHGAIRSVLAKELLARGWKAAEPRRRSHHWSAWTFSA